MTDPKDDTEANGSDQLPERLRLDEAIRKAPTIHARQILIALRERGETAPRQYGGTVAPGADSPPIVGPTIDTHINPDDFVFHGPDRPELPDVPVPELPPAIRRCARVRAIARDELATSSSHWWQNWGKHQAYVCTRMAFPTSVEQLAEAVASAERMGLPIRAVGGGYSFSGVTLPGDVRMPPPPQALGVEAWTKLVPLTETFPTDASAPVIASVATPGPIPDGAGLMVMVDGNGVIDPRWTYLGAGAWSSTAVASPLAPTLLADLAYASGLRPVRATGGDTAGTLGLFDSSLGGFITGAFYNGNGLWTWGVMSEMPVLLTLQQLVASISPTIRPRPFTAAWSLQLLAGRRPSFLINTFSMASSLQPALAGILCDEALAAVDPGPPELPRSSRKHYFHVEGGITLSALNELLLHQSPRLAADATAGSPGATLAGALATGSPAPGAAPLPRRRAPRGPRRAQRTLRNVQQSARSLVGFQRRQCHRLGPVLGPPGCS